MNLSSNIGRLRLLAWLEGTSLIVLVFVAVPLKYFYGDNSLSKTLGPLHGSLFLLFVINTFSVAIQRRWVFGKTTWKLLVACLVPFGTMYVDRKMLRRMDEGSRE